MKTTYLSCIVPASLLALALNSPQSALGDLLAYEGFDYANGSSLAGQNGGFGFSGAWGTSAGIATIQDGRLYVAGQAGSSLAIFRDLAAARGDEGTTTWISLTGVRSGVATGAFGPNGVPTLVRPVNFSLFQAGTEMLAIGEGTRTSGISLPDTDTWGLVDRGGVNNAGTRWTTDSLLTESMVVVRIDHGAGDVDTAYLWVNPGLDAEPDVANAISTTGNWSFNRIRPFAGGTNAASVNAVAEGHFDEFRMGTTFQDVAVPEPSTYALLGLGALALLLRRKKS